MIKAFAGQHLLSVQDLSLEAVETVFSVADRMVPFAERRVVTRVLEGAILGNMFFEPSTRTRVSFGCAFNLLGGEVRETIGMESSSLAKGESLEDTARVLSGYSDVIVMRHPEEGAVDRFAQASRVPVLNGGDGAREHPTQALLDLYTIRRERAALGLSLEGLRIALMGDLRSLGWYLFKSNRTLGCMSDAIWWMNRMSFNSASIVFSLVDLASSMTCSI